MDEQVRVPDEGADGGEFFRFAHTYNGYELHGGPTDLAPTVRSVQERWHRTGELGEDVDVLRACLFFEARAYRHGGGFGRFERQDFVLALVARIRALSGGHVPVKGTVA
ncbi:hypothetical protein [Micromonospora sagamiensis]|uniref:Uncharacterized protein n=1 Tax=Micromonospora sagamiensis TaxID=47875 RepID=A0A562WR12_9ACTN|nr:hypothetical protein [Micromonospora sagamiensis]TWJ31824.1 hypothetical protein JD81_05386 [Micromonospora sagamiensis]BCL15122.1 hypothetical protein GCM10017556_28610 [Micromonospora sagamiensis]